MGELRFGNLIYNRKVDSCDCDDGSKKILDEKYLQNYFNSFRLTNNKSPDPKDEHAIGAILAHAVNDLIEQEAIISNSTKRIDYIFDHALKYRQKILSQRKMTETAKLKTLLTTFLTSLNSTKKRKRLNSKQCDIMRINFPVFYKEWKYNTLAYCS